MKTEIMYATTCKLTIYFTDGEFASSEWREEYQSLKDALETAKFIIEDSYSWPYALVSEIIIWDVGTGEILAQCSPDSNREEDETPYDEWDDGDRWDLECGFDPYLGCYTDDC